MGTVLVGYQQLPLTPTGSADARVLWKPKPWCVMLGGKGNLLHPSEMEMARDQPLHNSARVRCPAVWLARICPQLLVVGQSCCDLMGSSIVLVMKIHYP